MLMPNLSNICLISLLLPLLGASLSGACTSKKVTAENSNEFSNEISPAAVNINTAGVEDLKRLPHVGPSLAEKIVAYREHYGPFRRSEHLLLIDGMSDRRFREIRHLIRIE
jgi:competence protein ComEA